MTVQFARTVSWTIPSIFLAGFSLAALLRKIDVVWVVLSGAGAAALSSILF